MNSVFLDLATVDAGDLDLAALRAAAPQLVTHGSTTVAQLPLRLRGADIVLVNKLRITREHLQQAGSVKLIALAATGTNNINLQAASEMGIGVCNIRDYCTPSVAQHVLGAILYLTHHFRGYSDLALDGSWAASPQFTLLNLPVRELRGCVLGIVGYGVLGQAVAKICETALGMRVQVAVRPGTTAVDGMNSSVPRLPLHELLACADVLSLHCPLTPATENLLGAAQLALMKSAAIIVNTARGGLIDSAALAQALRARRIGGAAIDVLPQEPPVDGNPLLAAGLPNLLLTPHVAWAARESRQRCLDEMAANIRDFLAGGRRGRVA